METTDSIMSNLYVIKFIAHVKEECKANKIHCAIRNVSYVKAASNIKCSGYFDHANRVLAVAMKGPSPLEILAHEYGHFTQWKEQCPEWVQYIEGGGDDAIEKWLAGEEIENVDRYLMLTKYMELDNEKRAVEIIKKWNLDTIINLKHYIKKCNAYVQWYNWLKISRKWTQPGNQPYTNQRLLDAMSTEFDMDYLTLTPELETIFREENI